MDKEFKIINSIDMNHIATISDNVISKLVTMDSIQLYQQAIRRMPASYGKQRLALIFSMFDPKHPDPMDLQSVRKDLFIALNGKTTPMACDTVNPFHYAPEMGATALHLAGASLQTAAAAHAAAYCWRKSLSLKQQSLEAEKTFEAMNALIEAEKTGNIIAESHRQVNALVQNMGNILEYRHHLLQEQKSAMVR